jgi:dihydroxyacetone kinase
MSVPMLKTLFTAFLETMQAKEDELGNLDAVAGDGDHGIGMVRGFKAAAASAQAATHDSASSLISEAGAQFSDAAGGSSGALVGIFIITIGNKLEDDNITTESVATALELGLARMAKLGKATTGQKTMLDTLDPFVTALKKHQNQPLADAWQAALPAAEAGMNATAEMDSKKGRASKLGERSKGHKDPGAVSMYYLLATTATVLQSA